MKKIADTPKTPHNPIFALVDHLKGWKSSATNYYKTFEDAFEACLNEFGKDELKAFFNAVEMNEAIKNKMNEAIQSIEIISEISDHNSQDYIDFQDKLNQISVSE